MGLHGAEVAAGVEEAGQALVGEEELVAGNHSAGGRGPAADRAGDRADQRDGAGRGADLRGAETLGMADFRLVLVGLAVTAAEMCLGGDEGMTLDLSALAALRFDDLLFSESNARWLVEVKRGQEDAFRGLFRVPVRRVGIVEGGSLAIRRGRDRFEVPVGEMRDMWANALAREIVR